MDHVSLLQKAAEAATPAIASAASVEELDRVEADLLGKTSDIGRVRSSIGQMALDERPRVGAELKRVTSEIETLLRDRRRVLEAEEAERRLQEERVDVTLPAVTFPAGALHLIQQTIDEITDIFTSIGYQVADGPEAELGWYNFDALNTPPSHPARFESDTMYLDYGDPADEILLRTQTSPVQVRWMETHEPPVHVIVPGKTYRLDAIDATHLPVFHQIEGLAVDADITFSDLKGTLHYFAEQFFGPKTRIRLRPHFFPFTEPSAELDVSCFNCGGGEPDCRVCKGAGWLEMLGCGMVHPAVFEAAGYDPNQVTGFAFGMGVERPAMVRHGITDIRNFIENDLRFLEQFK